MPFLAGGSLDGLSSPLDADDAIAVARAVAAGLSAAHSVSVLHLDLKPGNVMQDGFGNYLLADFGIARIFEQLETVNSQTMAFTPAYAAPELIDGSPPTTATDVYGLGATLVGLVTGAPLHQQRPGESTLQFYRRVVEEPVALPGRPTHDRLQPLLQAMLELDPPRRPSLDNVLSSLERLAAGQLLPPQEPPTEIVGLAPESDGERPVGGTVVSGPPGFPPPGDSEPAGSGRVAPPVGGSEALADNNRSAIDETDTAVLRSSAGRVPSSGRSSRGTAAPHSWSHDGGGRRRCGLARPGWEQRRRRRGRLDRRSDRGGSRSRGAVRAVDIRSDLDRGRGRGRGRQ